MSDMSNDEVQRSLGRIEGAQNQILSELAKFRVDFGDHLNADQAGFSAARTMITAQREEVRQQFEENDARRDKRFAEQDVKIDKLQAAVNRAKGAIWVIMGLVTTFGTIVAGVAVAVITGLWKIPR